MDQPADDKDLALVHQAQAGDYAAFTSLVEAYERRIYHLALRITHQTHDAEEVVQQTFLSLVEHLQNFREESRFSTWLLRIATNHALVVLRRRARRRTVPLGNDRQEEGYGEVPHPQFIAPWRETPEQIAGQHETQRMLDEALEQLDEKYRLVFLLRDVEELSTAATAEALGISISNVKVRLLRARLMLRELLTRRFGDAAAQVAAGHDHDDHVQPEVG